MKQAYNFLQYFDYVEIKKENPTLYTGITLSPAALTNP
jgi:hypothetical protein